MEMYAQGDILFKRVEAEPKEGVQEVENGIIATGELSGHTHRIRPGQQATLNLIAGIMYLRALQDTVVEHVILPSGEPSKDHDPIVLPPGLFEIVRQREWVPEGYRQVVD